MPADEDEIPVHHRSASICAAVIGVRQLNALILPKEIRFENRMRHLPGSKSSRFLAELRRTPSAPGGSRAYVNQKPFCSCVAAY